MQPAPPQSALSHQRRSSAIAEAFGRVAVTQGLERAASSVWGAVESSPTPARSSRQSNTQLFTFRQHHARKSVQSPSAGRDSSPSHRHNHHPLDAQARQDREQRKSIIAASMHHPSLSHLVVHSRKDTLDLDQLESTPQKTSLSSAHSAGRRSGSFVAFPESATSVEGVEDAETNRLWETVVSTNAELKERRKLMVHSKLEERVNPRWWRHLSLRDFSDFLTPGLFEDEELDAASDSDVEKGEICGEDATSKHTAGAESMNVQSGTGPPVPPGVDSNQPDPPPRSTRSIVLKKPLSALHISCNLLNPWTQHVTQRPPSHWTTPRRHGVHGGKSYGEIGTLTTVSARDFVAAANSLIGVCQAEERLLRLTLERSERSDAAVLFQALSGAEKDEAPLGDAALMLLVAETQAREDVAELEGMSLEWLVTRHVLLPAQVAMAERERIRAVNFYLEILKENQPKNGAIPMDEEVAALLSTNRGGE